MPDQIIPKGNIVQERSPSDYVKGISSPIPYLVRKSDGDWTSLLPSREPQKYKFETNECAVLSMINSCETQCNFLKSFGSFPDSTLKWFKDNGYFDSNGNFAFSERFIYALSGVYDNGNSQWAVWKLARDYGLLPRGDHDYSLSQSNQFGSQREMCLDYGNPVFVTTQMRQKALQCLKYIDIAYEWVGNVGVMPDIISIRAALYQAPLQIGIPVCMDTYNSGKVIYCGDTTVEHAVMLYAIDKDGVFYFFDHYNPYQKTLSKDYFIPYITNGVVTPIISTQDIPTVSPYIQTIDTGIWQSVWNWFVRRWY